MRTGRLANDEIAFIEEHAGRLTVAEMAARLGRREDSVEKILRKHVRGVRPPAPKEAPPSAEGPTARSVRQSIRTDLKGSEAWRRVQQELTADELRYFEEAYLDLMEQFESNILPAERTMVMDAVKIDLLKSRNLINQRRVADLISALEIEKERQLAGRSPRELDEAEAKQHAALCKQVAHHTQSVKEQTGELATLVQRGESLMKALKSTRDQRIQEIKSGATTFVSLVKKLQNREVQLRESREAELMRLAAERERERLSREHQYEDGTWDRPILSADTVVGKYDPAPARGNPASDTEPAAHAEKEGGT